MRTVIYLTLFILFCHLSLSAQDISGTWKTIDDETGKAKSIVKIEIKDGKAYGKILRLFRAEGEEQDPVCDECKGDLNGKKIIGMQIINGLEKDEDDNEWTGDDGILDPDNGKIYNCKLWVDEDNPDKLNVRGYIAFLYRTQEWFRVKQ